MYVRSTFLNTSSAHGKFKPLERFGLNFFLLSRCSSFSDCSLMRKSRNLYNIVYAVNDMQHNPKDMRSLVNTTGKWIPPHGSKLHETNVRSSSCQFSRRIGIGVAASEPFHQLTIQLSHKFCWYSVAKFRFVFKIIFFFIDFI